MREILKNLPQIGGNFIKSPAYLSKNQKFLLFPGTENILTPVKKKYLKREKW